jgi:uncharacterized membrane protein YbaN (DUF454 family)
MALGFIGVAVPIMPTAPFLILAAWCYSKGSPRFEEWLLNHRVLGPPVRNWREQGAISRRSKVFSTVVILSSLSMICFLWPLSFWVKGVLVVILGCALGFILSRPEPQVLVKPAGELTKKS